MLIKNNYFYFILHRFSKCYQTKTSTPKDTDQRHIGRKLQKRFTSNHKTPHSCLRRVQSNSCQTTSGRASPKHFQRLPSCNQSAETEPEELFSSSDSNQLENDSVNAHLSSNELKHLRYGSQRKYLGRKAKERSVKIGQGIIAGSERKRRVSVNWKNGDCDKRKIKPELVLTPQPKSILLTPGIRQHGKVRGSTFYNMSQTSICEQFQGCLYSYSCMYSLSFPIDLVPKLKDPP